MNIAFVFAGALTAEQEQTVSSSGGVVVGAGEYLNDFDLVVVGRGVKVDTDADTVPYAEYSPQPPKSEAEAVVLFDEVEDAD